MNITSAAFVKGVVGEDEVLDDGIPQIAFIGRSNVGKSSVINCLANKKNLAKTSAFAGRTQEINVFLINKSFYLVDLPGYGFAYGSKDLQASLQNLIYWYFFNSNYTQKKVVLIIDASIGATNNDMEMLHSLKQAQKNVIIVANKVDKIKKSEYKQQMQKIRDVVGDYKIFPFSAEKKIGISELTNEILN